MTAPRKPEAGHGLAMRRTIEILLQPEHLLRKRADWIDWVTDKKPLSLQEDNLGKAKRLLDSIPPMNALERDAKIFDDVAHRSATEAEAEMVAAIMIDWFPNAQPSSLEGYLNALVMVVQDEGDDPRFPRRLSREVLMVAAFTIIPFKVATIAAGATGMPIVPFALAAIVGRAGRFFLVAGLLRLWGPRIKVLLDKYFDVLSLLFLALLVLGFVAIKYVL